ncbi:hypothetical protein K4749_01265 [Streptomyces sp. TRM72054]|uniref:hypothetical protein n=1 Tax=Streptomyces sp. TRM72054 TaxID=2870562 RepID=UPI001C8BD846|nr:hypothetical protein [Streptomyces sp. TRM72054]MBX9392260.1 hypothetical protein [Streptomyces sp. TRM72054]
MSKTYMSFSVGFTANSPDNLPERDGEQMYADDVAEEMRDEVNAALTAWYQQRGHQLLACEPTVG